jgi:hypothetical protein
MVHRVRSQTPVNVVEESIEPSPVFAAFEALRLALSFVRFHSNIFRLLIIAVLAHREEERGEKKY